MTDDFIGTDDNFTDNNNIDKTTGLFFGDHPSAPEGPVNNAGSDGDPIDKLSSIWSGWKVAEQIGEGSYGKVYRIYREEHGFTDQAAVKVISIPKSNAELNSVKAQGHDDRSTFSYFEGIVKDFVNEIKIMAALKGTTNIVSIEDYRVVKRSGEIGWDIFIRMELLTSFISYAAGRKISEPEAIKIGQDICSALELCARNGIIHRDIKPENIFVSAHGDYKIGDFGIARKMDSTVGFMSTKGTPSYIAPEVELARSYDATVDIYSLGIVLYKLLNNNRLPFIDQNKQQVMYHDYEEAKGRRLRGEPFLDPVEASRPMASVILKACQFNPGKRFRTAAEFSAALEAVKKGDYKARKFNSVPLIIIGGVVALTLGLVFIFGRDFNDTTPLPPPVSQRTEPPNQTEPPPSPPPPPSQPRALHIVDEYGVYAETISLMEGESKTYRAVIEPDNVQASITAASEDPLVLDVVLYATDEIKVTGITDGTTILTVKITGTEIVRTYRINVNPDWDDDPPLPPLHSDDYIFSFSSVRLITDDELSSLNRTELRLARNEIFARLGRMFNDQELQDYFNSKSWYIPVYSPEVFDAFGNSALNAIEIENLHRIRAREAQLN